MIREAHAGDGAAMARLWIEAGEHHVRVDPLHHQRPDSTGLDAWAGRAIDAVAHSGGVTFVAERDGLVIGFVQVVLREPRRDAAKQIQRDQGVRRAWVNTIAVLESHRHQGVGRELMQAVEHWARSQAAAAIQLDVAPSNRPALGLYRAQGFEAIATVMEKGLE
jgi:ribosomal protein S18 acetylase RimI-like enzyme